MRRSILVALVAISAACATPPKPPPPPLPPPPPPKALTDADIAALAPPQPTFNKDVAPIVHQHCAGCHHPGEVAPFSLLSYEDVAKRADQIVRVTGSRFMPPWKPAPGYGEFQDVRALSDAEIATLAAWAKAGAPQGDGAAPEPPKFAEGWPLGPPDMIIKVPEPYSIPADGPDVYRCFVIPLGFTEDKDIAAMVYRPGNRRVVHHMIAFLDVKHQARKRDEADPGPGYKSFGGPGFRSDGMMGGWAPGMVARRFPEDVARKIPKGSDVVLQMHYHPDGKPEVDQSEVGIYFSKKPASRGLYSFPLLKPDLSIPPGEKHHREYVSFTLPIDVEALGVVPHMHLLGKEMRVSATLPDGTVKPMIWITDWDFNWQSEYAFKEPMKLPKGTTIELDAYYDNSDENPFNPTNPPRPVEWGEQTTDEMAIAFIPFASANPEDRKTIGMALAWQLHLWDFFKKLNR